MGIDWTELLSTILYAVIAAAVPVIVKAVYSYFKTKADKLLEELNNDEIRTALASAMDAVYTSVTVVNQTYVDALKDQNLFDATAQKEALDKALAIAKNLLTVNAKNVITDLYESLDNWLVNKIESTVNEVKES